MGKERTNHRAVYRHRLSNGGLQWMSIQRGHFKNLGAGQSISGDRAGLSWFTDDNENRE